MQADTSDMKYTKAEVDYRKGSSFTGRECKNCKMFRKPDSCTDVKGKIYQSGVCDIFSRKK